MKSIAEIREKDKELNAFIHIDDAAFDSAQTKNLPLSGLSMAIKDNIMIEGMGTTCGSKILENYTATYDATVIKKLRAAGAIIVGKTNMDEFAMGSSGENSAFGPTKNPHDKLRIPGGSSSGSTAAVAAGMVNAALGSDTGGSIRQPASLCGVVGLKPTYGRVSRYGLVAFASSLDQIGPITNSVEDAAKILNVIAGFDPLDSTSVNRPVPDFTKDLKKGVSGLKIGLPVEYFTAGIDTAVELAVKKAAETLKNNGARLLEISLPNTEYAVPTYYIIAPAEASSNLARFDGIRYGLSIRDGNNLNDLYKKTRSAGFGPEVTLRIIIGTYVLSSGYYDAYYKKAGQVRALIKDDFDRAFKDVDLILTPTTPTTAFKLGEKTTNPLQMYLSDIFTISCNLAGLPGVSLPCGFDSKGLPIGLQLMGKPLDELTLLQAAYCYEQVKK